MQENRGRRAVHASHWQRDIVGVDEALAQFFAERVAARRVVTRIGELLAAARRAGIPAIHVRMCWPLGIRDWWPTTR